MGRGSLGFGDRDHLSVELAFGHAELREWGAHEHPSLTSPDYAKPGKGLLLFFRVDNFDIALPRARALVSRLEKGPHVNPSTGTAEFSLRDP